MALPPLFLSRMQSLLGEETPAFLASYHQPPVAGLRVNTLKLSPQEFERLTPFKLEPIPWVAEGYLLPEPTTSSSAPGKHSYHASGLYYLQEPSAMAVVEALAPQPGEWVLDLAAAPGGKATHLAARLQGQGILIANEIHPRRAWDLAENLERWGARNAVITQETPEHLAQHFGAIFDRVLLDAPCSGEGLFRKLPTARQEWSPALVQSCATRQSTLLAQTARLVRPGGWLVYSTCTFAPEEDEAVILRFLEQHDEFTCTHPLNLPGFSPAIGATIPCAMRLWPHHAPGEGHFIARLKRLPQPHQEQERERGRLSPAAARRAAPNAASEQARRLFQDFSRRNLAEPFPFDAEKVELHGAYVYAPAEGRPALGGLKVIHPGVWLGIVKKERFEPSHALALCLEPAKAIRSVALPAAGSLIQAYLRGETLPTGASMTGADDDGWVLVTLADQDGAPRFPVGWGKRSGGLIKNFYPKGLRQF